MVSQTKDDPCRETLGESPRPQGEEQGWSGAPPWEHRPLARTSPGQTGQASKPQSNAPASRPATPRRNRIQNSLLEGAQSWAGSLHAQPSSRAARCRPGRLRTSDPLPILSFQVYFVARKLTILLKDTRVHLQDCTPPQGADNPAGAASITRELEAAGCRQHRGNAQPPKNQSSAITVAVPLESWWALPGIA